MPTATQMSFNTGPQDALLQDSGRSYFSNVGYVRTSNYAQEFKDIQPTNTAKFGTTVYWTIDRTADLLGALDLMVDFKLKEPATTGMAHYLVDGFGFHMVDKITFSVGTNDIQEIEGDWLYMENALMRDKDFKYDDLVLLDHDSVVAPGHGDLRYKGVCLNAASSTVAAGSSFAVVQIVKSVYDGSSSSADSDQSALKIDAGDVLFVDGTLFAIVITGETDGSGNLILDRDVTAPQTNQQIQVYRRGVSQGSEYALRGKQPKSQKRIVRENEGDKSISVVLPLGLFFTKHPSQFLPLAAIAGCNDIKVAIKFKPFTDLCFAIKFSGTPSDVTDVDHPDTVMFGYDEAVAVTESSTTIVDLTMVLRAQTYHLMAPEANALMSKEHVRLMTLQQVQRNEIWKGSDIGTGTTEKIINLSFLHPIKELFVTFRWDKDLNGGVGKASGSNRSYHSFLGRSDRSSNPENGAAPKLEIESLELSLNGNKTHPMPVTRDYMMKRLLPQHHSVGYSEELPMDGGTEEIYMIPFAMNPEGHNPSGHLNFSKVSYGRLHIKGKSAFGVSGNVHIDVWANYYNWLQIKDGRAVLSFQ